MAYICTRSTSANKERREQEFSEGRKTTEKEEEERKTADEMAMGGRLPSRESPLIAA